MTPGRISIATVMIRADRRWCMEHAADAMLPDHLNALARAVESQVGTTAVDDLRLEVANAKTLLGKLVRDITGEWKPNGNHADQVTAALRELRAVREYLTSLDTNQKGAA